MGEKVRTKVVKGRLDKSSTYNWSATIFEIRKVINGKPPKQTRYLLTNRQDDQQYTRNDIQIVRGQPRDIPGTNASGNTIATNDDDDDNRGNIQLFTGYGRGGQK